MISSWCIYQARRTDTQMCCLDAQITIKEKMTTNNLWLPPKFFSQVLACVVGSEEANPSNKKEWAHYKDGVDPREFQSMQN